MKNVNRTVNISEALANKIETALKHYPELDFNLVVSIALEQWLKGPQPINLFQKHETFIIDNSKGFGPESKK